MANLDPTTDPEIIALFRREVSERLRRLEAGVEALAQDESALEGCRREAHTIKGSAAMTGFNTIAEAAGQLLEAADNGRVDLVRARLAPLRDAVAAAMGPA